MPLANANSNQRSHGDFEPSLGYEQRVLMYFFKIFNIDTELLQGAPSPGGLGSVDLDLGCSTILFGQ